MKIILTFTMQATSMFSQPNLEEELITAFDMVDDIGEVAINTNLSDDEYDKVLDCLADDIPSEQIIANCTYNIEDLTAAFSSEDLTDVYIEFRLPLMLKESYINKLLKE